MAGKSLLHYFKPKVTPIPSPAEESPPEVVDLEEDEENVALEEDPSSAEESVEKSPSPPVVRRSTRACASRAREAWNDHQSSEEDDNDDFVVGRRKRARNSGSTRSARQTTLGKNGVLISKKENNNSKKKPKLDPEREAFLRSGVPDVIEKAKRKSVESGKKEDEKPPEPKKRQLDPETLAFLQSGVPESVLKAQTSVDKKKEENDFLESMGFFPKTSHVSCPSDGDTTEDNSSRTVQFKISPEEAESSQEVDNGMCPVFSVVINGSQDLSCLSSQDSGMFTPVGLCCDENPVKVISPKVAVKTRGSSAKAEPVDQRPWIDQMRVTSVKNLVVDKNALETLTRWLKQWKLDIKDDGGTSRKQEQKRKRGNSSDSDFITSDEEESEMKKKSVLLTGPTGCGKTAAVYVLAKHFGFEVVEVNFSSRRSGKEVLQRVEEAVLSHRLKSSHNCLLLFKDIDLWHPEEDEGFFSAVAQLITTAVRPIVMTSSLPSYYLIDSKLDKKDPLRISFALPKPAEIAEKILKPILASKGKLEVTGKDEKKVDRWLDSIVRHSGCDIRQCINQLQLLLSTGPNMSDLSNESIHLYSSPFQPHLVDLNFPRQSQLPLAADSQEETEQEHLNLSVSARKKRLIKQLDGIGNCLELFADLDYVSKLPSSRPTRQINVFGDVDEANRHWNHVSGMRSTYFSRLNSFVESQRRQACEVDKHLVRNLVLESDHEIDKWMEIDGLNEEIGQYCVRGASGMDWESCAAVRSIVKTNLRDSAVGKVQKRHGRMVSYFNRLDRRLVDKITNTLGFQEELDSVKVYS